MPEIELPQPPPIPAAPKQPREILAERGPVSKEKFDRDYAPAIRNLTDEDLFLFVNDLATAGKENPDDSRMNYERVHKMFGRRFLNHARKRWRERKK